MVEAEVMLQLFYKEDMVLVLSIVLFIYLFVDWLVFLQDMSGVLIQNHLIQLMDGLKLLVTVGVKYILILMVGYLLILLGTNLQKEITVVSQQQLVQDLSGS